MTDKEFINKYAQNPNNVALDFDKAKRNGESIEPLMVVTVEDLQQIINTVRKSLVNRLDTVKMYNCFLSEFLLPDQVELLKNDLLTAPIQETKQ